MTWIDARLPLRFGSLATREPGEAVLTDRDIAPAGTHASGCRCCAGQSAAGAALSQLFRERAVGAGEPFRAVLAVVGPAAEAAIRKALAEDSVAVARYRLT